jgi:hypothetical protein
VKGAINLWGDNLVGDLEKLSGTFDLILIGPGPVQAYLHEEAAQQRARILEALERWGKSFLFHLFSTDAEYRYDHGVGCALTIGPEGPFELADREYYLVPDPNRMPGMGLLHQLAPTGRLKVQEFLHEGSLVDFKLEALI